MLLKNGVKNWVEHFSRFVNRLKVSNWNNFAHNATHYADDSQLLKQAIAQWAHLQQWNN